MLKEEEANLENRWFNVLQFYFVTIRISNKSKELCSKYRRAGSEHQLMCLERLLSDVKNYITTKFSIQQMLETSAHI